MGSDYMPSATSRVDGRLPCFLSSDVIVKGNSFWIGLIFLIGVPNVACSSSFYVMSKEGTCWSLFIAVMNLGGIGFDVELAVDELSPRLCLDCF